MSWADEYLELKKKRKKKEETTEKPKASNSWEEEYIALREKRTEPKQDNFEAPVRTTAKSTTSNKKDSKLDFFQKGAFEDGISAKTVAQGILGTAGDAALGIVKGIGGLAEGIGDLGVYGVAGVADLFGADDYAEKIRKRASNSFMDGLTKDADNFLDKYSVLGRTSDAILQGVGQVGAIVATGGLGASAGLSSAGVTALTTGVMGASGVGSGMGEAYQSGATDEEAFTYGMISGAADALSELMFGGLGKSVNALGFSKGLSSADDMLAKAVSGKFKNQIAKNFAEFGVKASAEGLEEVVAGVAQAMGKKATYMSDEEFGNILKDENLLEQFIVGSVTSGMIQSGIIPGTKEGSLVEANETGRDLITGFNQNEQAVINKEIEKRIAEQESDGNKLTAREKSAIEAQVEKDLDRGYISIDTIEEALGGETFKTYRDTISNEDSILEEFDTLNKMKQGDMTGEQIDRWNELKQQAKDIKSNSLRGQLKSQLESEVFNLAKGDRLVESYNERARRGQAFEADLSQYNEKQQAVIQKAIDSGVLNNTNRTHEFVDMIAKISADKGVLFDFTNNEKLKESSFAVDGKAVNGYVTKDGITLNINASKSLNTVVGHEITHVLEGTDLYSELQNTIVAYAKARGDYQGRYDSLSALYEGIEGADINAELTADLVGDYLFTDSDFINNLSVNNRNVFQKIYDEIKYLCKVATAGSNEARELEKVKKAFDKAYREGSVASEESGQFYDSETKYSLRVADKETVDFLENQEHITTYKTMQIVDGKLYPPMASRIEGKHEDYSVLGEWEQATEHPELIKNGKFKLDKGKGNGSLEAAYNPYMHSSNLVLNDQFSGAYKRDNLVTVECEVPVSEATSGYQAEFAKDSVGWKPWHTGTVAGQLRKANGTERQVFLSRWIKPVRIVPDSEVASMYKGMLDGTDIEVPDNVVTPALLQELKNAGVKIKESGRLKAPETKYSLSGVNKDGIEVYETSEEVKNLTNKERMNLFESIMENEYRGRTAKFIRNGHAYYATFDDADISKNIYGDKKSSKTGWKAKIKTGADGNIFELVENSNYTGSKAESGKDIKAHDGIARWDYFVKTVQIDNAVYNVLANVRKTNNEEYVYSITLRANKKISVSPPIGTNNGSVMTGAQYAYTENITQDSEKVNAKYSLSDSDGKQLSNEQQEYFKDSKMRDANGNLKVMYHGSQDAGFHEFVGNRSDDGISFFFTDSMDVASSYSGTSETYEARPIRTTGDFVNFLSEIGESDYEVTGNEESGYFVLDVDGDTVAESNNLQGLYEEFCDYMGIGYGDANYKVYLNLKNPLVVDAEGRNWDNISREFSQEIYDKYQTLTTEEKNALTQLASWEDIGIFRDEIRQALVNAEQGTTGVFDAAYTKNLASAYQKVGGGKGDIYRLFDIATDNFTEESLRENAVKQLNTRDYATQAKEQGYDGVIFNNIVDIGGYGGDYNPATVAIAFDSNQIKSVANQKPTGDPDIRYSLSEGSVEQQINESLTMKEAQQMIQRAFVIGDIYNWFDGEYRNGDEWLKAQGAEDVAMVVENEYSLQQAYLDKIEGLMNEDFSLIDILDAYSAGTLTGKTKKKNARVNVADGVQVADKRFYAPKEIKNAKSLYEIANQRVTNRNREEVTKARAAILLYAHNKGAAETLGITNSDLNKKLRTWGGYSAEARNLSLHINDGVHDSNRWAGIENVSWLNKATVSNDEVARLVKSVEGDSDTYQKRYIARTMLSLDTHIDWSWLNIKFDTHSGVNEASTSGRCNGYYRDSSHLIHVKRDAPNTVAHEMGHALDHQWGRELGYNSPITEISRNTEGISGEARVWFDNFKEFADSLVASSDLRSEYSMDVKETFARFVAKFVEWTEQVGTGRSSGYESNWYNDKFTTTQFVEFARLLQEKSALDSRGLTENKFSLSDVGKTYRNYGGYNVYGKDLLLKKDDIAPVAENATTEATVAKNATVEAYPTDKDLFPDDLAPMDESQEVERANSLTDADAPEEFEAPYPDESDPVTVEDPFEDRDWYEMKDRSVKAYMYENPEVKSFFQEEAYALLGELNDTTKGERFYNDDVYYESGGEQGFSGVKRHTSESMEVLLDQWHMSYADIEKGLNAIIEDHGAENIAAAKKIEFMLNDRLLNGYKNFYGNDMIPPNQDYINLLNEKQINEYSTEAFDRFMETADQYAPAEDIAPVKDTAQKAPVQEAQKVTEYNGQTYAVGEQLAMWPKDQKKPSSNVAQVLTEEPNAVKKATNAWNLLKEKVFDNGMVFEDLSIKRNNREIQAKWNFIRNSEKMAQRLIGKGTHNVPSLQSIKTEVDKSGKTEAFYLYMYHKHNADRMTLSKRYPGAEDKAVFGDTITADMSKAQAEQLERANPEFRDWSQQVYKYTNYLRDLLVENDVISMETAKLWAEMYPHYVPIRREGADELNINVPLDSRKTGVNAPVKRATGGSRNILPLFDTMADRTLQTFRAINKNSFGLELMDTLGTKIATETNTVDGMIDSLDSPESLLQEGKDGNLPTFTVFDNGERVTFEITDEMYEAMKPKSKLMSYTNKALNTASNLHRALLTEYNPVFTTTNAIKDFQDVIFNSQHPAMTYAHFIPSYWQLLSHGKWYTEYVENGGESNTYFDSDSKTFIEENGVKKVITFLPEVISKANNFIEMAPRLAEYIASRKAGRSIEVSMLDAARVTTNFAAGGEVTKLLNRNGCTFFGASVNGAVQQVRNVREAHHKGLMGYMGLATRFIVAGLPAYILNDLLWDDDEEYEELSDYVKQNYYVVGKTDDGKFKRIPKGRTVAVVYNAIEQFGRIASGDEEADWGEFLKLVVENLAPNNPIDNNVFAPVGQVLANKTWYGEDLVPSRLQDVPTAEQYDESTDSISKWLGEKLDISPVKINYLLNQYSGGVGDVVLPMLTPEAESGDVAPTKNEIVNTVVSKAFAPFRDKFTTDAVLNNQNVSDFYDTKDQITVNSNSIHATEEDGMKALYMDAVSWEMSDLYKQKRKVQNSDLSDSEKYAKVRDIQDKINSLARDALGGYNDVSIDGKYSEVGNKRFNYDDENGKWYEIREKNSDGSPNKWYEKEQEVTKGLGISYSQYWNDRDEYNFAYDYPEKYKFLNKEGYSYDDYATASKDKKRAFSWAAKNPDKYEVYKAVSDDFFTTYQYNGDLYDIKADKDENGDSISGTAKAKKIDYINNLDLEYGQKIILFKHLYEADDTYNYEIIDYLNSRDDISYEQMETILKELGFKVDSDGNISW